MTQLDPLVEALGKQLWAAYMGSPWVEGVDLSITDCDVLAAEMAPRIRDALREVIDCATFNAAMRPEVLLPASDNSYAKPRFGATPLPVNAP